MLNERRNFLLLSRVILDRLWSPLCLNFTMINWGEQTHSNTLADPGEGPGGPGGPGTPLIFRPEGTKNVLETAAPPPLTQASGESR